MSEAVEIEGLPPEVEEKLRVLRQDLPVPRPDREAERRERIRRIRLALDEVIDAVWRQVKTRVEVDGRELFTYREFQVGNRVDGVFSRPRLVTDPGRFRAIVSGLSMDLTVPCLFLTLHRLYMDEVILVDFALDLDWKHQPARLEAWEGLRFLDGWLREQGIKIRWVMTHGGVHGYLDLSALGTLGSERLRSLMSGDVWAVYSEIASMLERRAERAGFRLRLDHQIYRRNGTIRAIWSPHESATICTPARLSWPPFCDRNYGRMFDLEIPRDAWASWGGLKGEEGVEAWLKLVSRARARLEWHHALERSRPGCVTRVEEGPRADLEAGERRVLEADGLRVVYPAALEGYGYIEVLLGGVYPADGRETLIWRVLGPAVGIGLIEREEAEDYIRRCLEAKPDPEKDVRHYLQKLRHNVTESVNPPTWRTLLTLQGKLGPSKDPEGLRHLRDNLLQALAEAGVVEVRGVTSDG